MHGGDALRERLDELAGEIADEVAREGMRKGWHAQLSGLTSTARGRAAATAIGVKRETLVSWLAEKTEPRRKSDIAAIERVYLDDRKEGRSRAIAQQLRDHLTNRPSGTQVEIYTEDHPETPRRTPTIRPDQWDDIVDAFEDDDWSDLEGIWEDIIDGLDTSGNEADLMMNYVSSLGF